MSMEMSPFRDWRNRKRVDFERPKMQHVDRFRALPYYVVHETKKPTWLNYPPTVESIPKEQPTGRPSWTYCPAGNWTWFDVEKAPRAKRKQFERFDGYNNGLYILNWSDDWYLNRLDNWYLCNAISSALDLTHSQKSQVQFLFHSPNLKRRGLRLDFVIYVLAALVCHRDGRKTYPHPNTKDPDPLFKQFAEQHNYRPKLIRRWFHRFRGQLAEDLPNPREPPIQPKQPGWWSLGESDSAVAGT